VNKLQSSLIIHDGNPAGLPVVVGCPFETGPAGWQGGTAAMDCADGTCVPAQCAVLNPPNPEGVQWLELSFLATARGAAEATLTPGQDASAGLAAVTSDSAVVQNDRVRVTLDTRPDHSPLRIETRDDTGATSMVPLMLAIDYERIGDPDFLQAGLVCIEFSLQHGISGHGSVKPSAMTYRTLCRFLGHADRAGRLAPFELATVRERQQAFRT